MFIIQEGKGKVPLQTNSLIPIILVGYKKAKKYIQN